ncbi:hypothetical protein FRB93_000455 [Tulasnella sp. JGI-2019a]|nr:hypothetical protein FRB93_000455 [Tulasnella sp. JGI-2019a]
MSSAEHVEEGYPLASLHTGGDNPGIDGNGILPSPAHDSAGRRTRRRFGTFNKLHVRFYSFRPLIRLLIIVALGLVPIYYFFGVELQGLFRRPPRPPGYKWSDEEDAEWPILPPPPPTHPGPPSEKWERRAQEVKDAFIHAYRGYEAYAFPADELLPLTRGGANYFNGWGVTTVDSLDTMWMMGLKNEYQRGVEHVERTQYGKHDGTVPFFETSIRYFGGILSAYAKSNNSLLLQKADELGAALLPAFDSNSGLPFWGVNPKTGNTEEHWGPEIVILAEMGSCQMEYKYLAHLTGKREYFDKMEKIMNLMRVHQSYLATDLISVFFSTTRGMPVGTHFSVGALADSAYEYLLKQYLMTNKTEKKTMEMYLRATKGIIENLLYISYERQLLFVTDIDGYPSQPSYIFEHLSCFLPGLFALGAHTLSLPATQKQLHLWIAEGLANTCYLTYMDQRSSLGPDEMQFWMNSEKWYPKYKKWLKSSSARRASGNLPPGVVKEPRVEKQLSRRDYSNRKHTYLLRPETVESFFILYRVTGEEKWRDRGYDIFRAIQDMTKTEFGYASIMGIDTAQPTQMDSMPSYFLAETLKYLWLLFAEDDGEYDLNQVIFNTEAHPLPVFNWTAQQIKDWRIPVASA